MSLQSLSSRIDTLRHSLTLDGRLSLLQPWALVPGPLALLLALAIPYRWLFFLAYVWFAVVIACYLWVRRLASSVDVTRSLQGAWAEVGDLIEERWTLENRAWLPLIWLELDDESNVPGYNARRVAACGPREHQHWETSARCQRRGVYTLGPLTLRMADPLGIFGAAWRKDDLRQIIVYPTLMRLPEFHPPNGQSGGLARADLLQQAATPSVGGLRHYVPGDQPSRIHWPTVARTRQLMVKEFDQERAGALWIALDLNVAQTRPATPPPEEHPAPAREHYGQSSLVVDDRPTDPTDPLELAVVLTASLAALALAAGWSVGLVADDGRRRVVMPGHGPRQLWRILGALVDAEGGSSVPVAELVARGPGSPFGRSPGALALVSADLSGSWIAALAGWQLGRSGGAQALLVGLAEDRPEPLLARLSGLGVPAQFFRVGERMTPLHPPRPRASLRVSPLGTIRSGGS